MKKTTLQIATKKIRGYFKKRKEKIYKKSEINIILKEKREEWQLAKSVSINKFIEFLTKEINVRKFELKFPNRKEIRYVLGEIHLYKIITSVNSIGYFSHLSALYLNKFIQIEPREIYFNIEQTVKPAYNSTLSQEGIRKAFENKARITKNVFEYDGLKIFGLSGKNTKNLGVVKIDFYRVTDIERTLIDITVRPQYAGGVKNVMQAYKNCRDKVSVNKIIKYLKKLNYSYPYHQSIGWYLESAGLKNELLEMLEKFGAEFDFYLENQMKEPKYSKRWRIFFPSNI